MSVDQFKENMIVLYNDTRYLVRKVDKVKNELCIKNENIGTTFVHPSKITIIIDESKTIKDFLNTHDLNLSIRKNLARDRWIANLAMVEEKIDNSTKSLYGSGETTKNSLISLCRNLSNTTIIYDSCGENRKVVKTGKIVYNSTHKGGKHWMYKTNEELVPELCNIDYLSLYLDTIKKDCEMCKRINTHYEHLQKEINAGAAISDEYFHRTTEIHRLIGQAYFKIFGGKK